MPQNYCEYLKVNTDFVPVFSRYEDQVRPNYWKGFYPHSTFIKILENLAGSVQGATAESKRSLWIYGAYGTGKSYAAFTLKHLLEENEEDVVSYFKKYNIKESLLNKLTGIKGQGDVLVVYRESSSNITSENKLFGAVQESVKEALKQKGYKYFGSKSLRDNILDRLTEPHGAFNFEGAFKKYREKFKEYADPQDVIKDLKTLDADICLDLLERILETADQEGFNFAKSVDDVVFWLEDVIKGNDLLSVIFMWDEFTDFFKINPHSTSGLQALAHASSKIPFYLFLITHKAHEQFIFDADSRKKLEARFKMERLEMADATAFELMANSIEIDPNYKNEWETINRDLWFKTEKVFKSIKKYSEHIQEEHFKKLLPLHPYSALILQDIASKISSNQRTMFQFLCGAYDYRGEIKHNFRWYIDNHNRDSWNLLTCDFIWDYFFEPGNVDLEQMHIDLMSHYAMFEGQCPNEDWKRVLKTVLLLTAAKQEKGRGISNLLRPTLSNIKLAFWGTPLEGEAENILAQLAQKGVLGSLQEGLDTLFLIQSQNIDIERLKECEELTRSQYPFEKLIDESQFGVDKIFSLTGYMEQRFEIITATYNNISSKVSNLQNWEPYKIPVILLLAKNEEAGARNHKAIEKLLIQNQTRDIIIADLSSQPLMEQEYESFIACMAKGKYFGASDKMQSKLNADQARRVIENWKDKLRNTIITIRCTALSKVYQLKGEIGFAEKLDEINSRIFPAGLESLVSHEKMFKEGGFSSKVIVIGMDKLNNIPSSFSYLNNLKIELLAKNIWQNPCYYKDTPSHALSKMKTAVEELIQNEFEKRSSAALIDVWNRLQEKPFGLYPSIGTAFLMGFLLKEYADKGFYKKDAIGNSLPLTHDNLADMIECILKNKKGCESNYIVRMTTEQEQFCRYSGEIFNLASQHQNSIQDVKKHINSKLSAYEYPLWTLEHYLRHNDTRGLADETVEIIQAYCRFISAGNGEETAAAEEISDLLNRDAAVRGYLKNILKSENLKKGMEHYVTYYKPDLEKLARRLDAGKEYIIEINKAIPRDANWLWDKGDIDKLIDGVYLDYRLVEGVNLILLKPVSSLSGAAHEIKKRINSVKMPLEFFEKAASSIVGLFKELIKISEGGGFKSIDKEKLLTEINKHADEFNRFYNHQEEIFGGIIQDMIKQPLSDEEIRYLFSKAESQSISMPLESYLASLQKHYDNYLKNARYKELITRWKEISGSDSPIRWSEENEIPILCLFTKDSVEAKDAFNIINSGQAGFNDRQIQKALDFISLGNIEATLKDLSQCNQVFKNYIAGEYDILFDNIDELKNLLRKRLGGRVYDWYFKKQEIDRIVKDTARKKYETDFYKNVFDKIDNMPPDKAKEYLKDLIKREFVVGLKIMKS